MKRLFLPLGFISGIPFIIPLSNYIYVGIILFNLRFFSWWVIVLLAFWAYVTVMGSEGARAMLKEELDKKGLTPELGINTLVFNLLRFPFPIAAIYAIKKSL